MHQQQKSPSKGHYQAIADNPSSAPQQVILNENSVKGTPTKGFALQLSIAVSALAICAGIVCFLCQLTSIFIRFSKTITTNPLSIIFQLYGLAFCVLIVLVELEIVGSAIFLHSWSIRGLFHIFLGLFVLEVHSDAFDSDLYLHLIVLFSGPLMCLVGFIYIVMGVISLKKVRDQQLAKYVQLMSHVQMQHIGATPRY